MHKSLLAIPFLAVVMALPVTASAGETFVYLGSSAYQHDHGFPAKHMGHYGYSDDRRHGHTIRKRLKRQQARINDGVESGQLTRKEAKKLRRQNKHIAGLFRDYRSDGRLGRFERTDLVNRLDRASDRIYRLKHNDRMRGDRNRWDRYSYRY
jgi:hypothetical protein